VVRVTVDGLTDKSLASSMRLNRPPSASATYLSSSASFSDSPWIAPRAELNFSSSLALARNRRRVATAAGSEDVSIWK